MRVSSRILGVGIAICSVLGPVGAAQATPITFLFSGTSTGLLAGTPFTDAPFVFTMSGDTDNISFPFGADTPNIDPITTNLSIDTGIETIQLSFIDPVYVFNNRLNTIVGFGQDPVGDFWDQGDPSLSGYALDTSFGPLTTDDASFGIVGIATSGGSLSMSLSGPATFQAISLATVPESGSVALFLIGVPAMAGLVLRRRR